MSTAPSRGRSTPPPSQSSIWLVEDSALEAEQARQALVDHGRVTVFAHGAQMLERLAQEGLPDVLVLDWELPDMSGIEICRFVRSIHDEAALPIVMLTVFGGPEKLAEALRAGANDYVRKPFDPVELGARIDNALRTKRLFVAAREAEDLLAAERDRLRASEARFRRLADSGILAIVQMDRAGLVVEANDAFLALVGVARTDVLGGRVRMRDITPVEYHDADDEASRELVRFGVCTPYEKQLCRSDGARISVIQGVAVVDGTGGRSIAYLLDVTRQRSAEADRARLYEAERKARAEAEAASRMKDDFLATVSHEIRTPLNAIRGWASIARSPDASADDVARALETIERNARAQAKLIDDILDVSRIVTGKVFLELARVDFRLVVKHAVDSLGPTATAKGLHLACVVPDEPCIVAGDADRLQQVTWNLLTNAAKFTPAGGHVTATLTAEPDAFTLTIEDDGQGMTPDFLPFVFERFRQADASSTRRHGGLGLGLSIVRNLVELHGGSVSADSPGKDRGSTFRVVIPRAHVDAIASAPVATPVPRENATPTAQRDALAGLAILVVDDEDDSRDVVAAILSRFGATVIGADGVEAALEELERTRFDVVVSDIGMPIADGYALVRSIRGRSGPERDVPAIALTAYARSTDARRATSEGFQKHLSKPVDPQLLVQAVLALTRR